ncbi:MAG: nonstructural protein [Microvirus sp.]|nr:MAG: nonstructural protein [Microvirus sp.]
MAKLYVCSVFDAAVQAFARPICVPATGMALRSFSDEVNRAAADNQLYGHAADFSLYMLGTFEEDEGTFVNEKVLLVRGVDVKAPA